MSFEQVETVLLHRDRATPRWLVIGTDNGRPVMRVREMDGTYAEVTRGQRHRLEQAFAVADSHGATMASQLKSQAALDILGTLEDAEDAAAPEPAAWEVRFHEEAQFMFFESARRTRLVGLPAPESDPAHREQP
ncbi:hypothetical protein [Nocardia huaxiensis]|uniref:Uncharacterized protein n=1 Tax=Nocardia huaxiensis TaxID=2755382 RepID=A0A7D7A0V0_9NOCA|nr:hypothetical protein [Nocardia huaxiensis]QLY33229.1 hypothetical protein H0264_14235 [Nocardia huaxiensis]UFS99838.1 hypothetical protein LPY97_19145 [Nocardia huaxiensis]